MAESLTQTLPPESILRICDYIVDVKDVISFRLSSRYHAILSAERLFRELHVMFRPKSFHNLLQVAKHPVFSKYVKSVFYEGAMVDPRINRCLWELLLGRYGIREYIALPLKRPTFPTECQWDSSVCHWEGELQFWEEFWNGPAKSTLPAARLSQGWSEFQQIQIETADIIESGQDTMVLAAAFKLFPNLEAISMQTDCKATVAMKTTFDRALFLPTITSIPLVRRIAKSKAETCLHLVYSGTRQLSSILEASVSAGHKLKSLSAAYLDWKFFSDGIYENDWIHTYCRDSQIFERLNVSSREKSFWCQPYHQRFESAFHSLVHLDFRFKPAIFKFDDPIEVARFGKAIASAKNLRSLTLNFGDTDSPSGLESSIEFKRLIGGKSPFDRVIWPHLTFLELHYLRATHEEWTAFFRAHSSTLCKIHLSSLWLSKSDEYGDYEWDRTLLALREILHGKNVEFRGVFSAIANHSWSAISGIRHIVNERLIDMERKTVGSCLGGRGRWKRLGSILREWFLEDPSTNRGLVENHLKMFKLEDEDDSTPNFGGGFSNYIAGDCW